MAKYRVTSTTRHTCTIFTCRLTFCFKKQHTVGREVSSLWLTLLTLTVVGYDIALPQATGMLFHNLDADTGQSLITCGHAVIQDY